MKYDVKADIYEGPLPLLVELAKLNLVDVFIVKLVDLTKQYLQQLKASGLPAAHRVANGAAQAGLDLNQLAEPLPLLGQLLTIKARGLLPQPQAAADDEEVPISLEELERRLKEYEQFKTVAQLLAELHALQHEHFTRPRAETPEEETAGETAPWDVGLPDLMSAFAKVLEKAQAPVYEMAAEPWTVEMKVTELRVLLTTRRRLVFHELFAADKTTLELVVTFLALLELLRQRAARAIQERTFGEIVIVAVQEPSGAEQHRAH